MTVPSLMMDRWWSGRLTGEAQHSAVVRVRQGYMARGYFDDAMLDGRPLFPPLIWKGINHNCWKARWTPTGPWITLPNIQSVKWTRSFQDKGSAPCTIVMDNIAFTEEAGVSGMYHIIDRGHFSPMRGTKVLSRPSLWEENQWGDVLNGGYQVEVWEGYGTGAEVQPGGDSVVRTYVGLIENCDLETHPDHITITARDFTVLLTDQRVMGWNKAREIRAPITFADRKQTQGEGIAFDNPKRSSGAIMTDPRKGVVWISNGDASQSDMEWVQIDLPAGHYEEFMLQMQFSGYEMWAAVHAAAGSTKNDSEPLPVGWVDLGFGSVPGTIIPYVTHVEQMNDLPHRWKLGPPTGGIEGVQSFDFTDGSYLRVYISNLQPMTSGVPTSGPPAPPAYFAQTSEFYALRFGSNPNVSGAKVNANHWILVEDAASVVRMVLIWAGFREFHVEDFGWTLQHPLQFGEDKFFMDIIDEMLKQGNFTFYMDMPTGNDESIGVPHFEYQKATSPPPKNMVEVRDTDMTEALQVTWDLSNLPYVIRYRGDISKTGQTLDQDLVKRYMATYYPPWSRQYSALAGAGASTGRVAGVLRHFSQTLGSIPSMSLESNEECLFACLLVSIQFCLQMVKGDFQIAGLPAFSLNGQVSLIEASTGVNSRLWVASIESDHNLGPKGSWKMKIGGSMLDVEDMYLIASDYQYAYKHMLPFRPPSSSATPASIPDIVS